MDYNKIIDEQKKICDKVGVPWFYSPVDLKVGIAENMRNVVNMPLNGLRHPPEGDTTGWYLWAGEKLSDDPHFFKPLHLSHVEEWCPVILKYLGLPPGWRFLIDDKGYEDIWEDKKLLEPESGSAFIQL